MRKRVIILCSVIIVCALGFGAMALLQNKEDGIKNISEFNPVDAVTMDIVEGSLTNTRETIIITDLSGEDNTYGEYYRIDKLVDDTWYELEDIVDGDVGWISIAYFVDDDNTLTMDIDWEKRYGSLSSGKYRIVKDFFNENQYDVKHVAAEFTIE